MVGRYEVYFLKSREWVRALWSARILGISRDCRIGRGPSGKDTDKGRSRERGGSGASSDRSGDTNGFGIPMFMGIG